MYSKKRCMPRKVRSRKYKKSTKNRISKGGEVTKPTFDFNPLNALGNNSEFNDFKNMTGRFGNVAKKALTGFNEAAQPTKRQRTKDLNNEIKNEKEKLNKIEKELKKHTEKETKLIEKQKGLVERLEKELDMLNKSTIGPDEPISNIKPKTAMAKPMSRMAKPMAKPMSRMAKPIAKPMSRMAKPMTNTTEMV